MIKVAILGYGGRGRNYALLCKNIANKNNLEVVAVIDTSKDKLALAKSEFGLADDKLFNNIDEFIAVPKMADYLFICTQDKQHHEHSIKALNSGYNLLLEKPIACSIEDCIDIARVANEKGLKVDVCHVLRYSGYYEKIKEIMDSGVLGKIVSIEQIENVAYWHQAHSFVRGDWRKSEESNPMILAKCCHDLDIAVYLAESKCKFVSSIGKLNYFKKENAPEGCTEYCLGGCKVKDKCPYDCEKLYIKNLRGIPSFAYKNMWPQSRLMSDSTVTIPKLYEACKNTDFGRCVFLSDNDVVDYQTVQMEFENGITSTLTMTAFSGKSCCRETVIRGTLGVLHCHTDKPKFILEVYGKKPKKIARSADARGSHGGGDGRLINALANGKTKTDINMSIESHLMAFLAEQSRLDNGIPKFLDEYRK